MARILVVDDEQSMRVMLEARLAKAGHAVELAPDMPGVDRVLAASEFDVVITDLRMKSGRDGLDVVRKVKSAQAEAEVILMTAFGSDDVRRQALELGAYGYVEKSPTLAAELIALVKAAVQKRELARRGRMLAQDNELLREQLSARGRFDSMVARSGVMHRVFEVVEKVASARTTVLITGESGVGKELVARAVHSHSPRASGPFVPVNCGAIPEGLIESELFGHAKGAFTGAIRDQPGRVEVAEGGTLFLDEIGDLPASLQAKLLRFLQEKRFERVGEARTRKADVRVVAATNRDLEIDVQSGRFREDLLFRLNVIEVRVPSLRERPEDIVPMTRRFLSFFAKSLGRAVATLSPAAEKVLTNYDWPGNVRELRNAIERAMILWPSTVVEPQAFPERIAGTKERGPHVGGKFTLDDLERAHISAIVSQSKTMDEAAAVLGIDDSTLWRKRKKYEEHDLGG